MWVNAASEQHSSTLVLIIKTELFRGLARLLILEAMAGWILESKGFLCCRLCSVLRQYLIPQKVSVKQHLTNMSRNQRHWSFDVQWLHWSNEFWWLLWRIFMALLTGPKMLVYFQWPACNSTQDHYRDLWYFQDLSIQFCIWHTSSTRGDQGSFWELSPWPQGLRWNPWTSVSANLETVYGNHGFPWRTWSDLWILFKSYWTFLSSLPPYL